MKTNKADGSMPKETGRMSYEPVKERQGNGQAPVLVEIICERVHCVMFDYAINTIGQPGNTAIYFAVDYNATKSDLADRIVPHFRAINAINDGGEFSRKFRIGAYGSGLTLETLLDEGLAELAWLSQSTGHRRSRAFKRSNRWTIFQHLPSRLCGITLDRDTLNPNLTVDAARFGPKIARLFAAVVAQLGGELSIQTNRRASVVIDGRPVDDAPCRVRLALGRHEVVITDPSDGRAHRREVMIQAVYGLGHL